MSTGRKYSHGPARPAPADPLLIILQVIIGVAGGVALLWLLAWLYLNVALSGGGAD